MPRSGLVPMFTTMDVVRLMGRVARLQVRPDPPCTHVAYPVGPYLICRNLSCKTLVVTK
jgi:hypothetical protein